MRLITVTPAGRRRYLEILANYLLRNRHVIDEHHWWVNTRNPDDLAYLHQLVDRYPNFFRLVVKPIDAAASIGPQIWSYLSDCTDPDTNYLRLDDDICYVADDAIRQLRDYRIANPDPFLVLGSIVNNAICSHYFQKAGRIPISWGNVAEECLDPIGWESPRFAYLLHRQFLRDLSLGYESKWKGCENSFDGLHRFSVNAICWSGKDMQQVAELHHPGIEEEVYLTETLPQRFKRPAVICSDALFGHFAFYTQRKYIELLAPQILDQYRRLSLEGGAGKIPSPKAFDYARLGWEHGIGRTKWIAREVIHGAKDLTKLVIKSKGKEKQAVTNLISKPKIELAAKKLDQSDAA